MARRLFAASGITHPGTAQVKGLARQITRWEAGLHCPQDWAATIAELFGATADELFPSSQKSARPSEEATMRLHKIIGTGGDLAAIPLAATKVPVQTTGVNLRKRHHDDLPEDEEMQRRRLLQALAALGVASTPAVEAIEHIRDGVDRAIGRDDASRLEAWEETVAEYGYSYLLLPPHVVLRDLATDLAALQLVTGRRTGDRLPWYRVNAGLSVLMAKTLCNMQQPRLAREWWSTAQHAADASGDVDLALWIRGEHLVYGLYEGHPTSILLRKADRVVDGSPAAECRGMLHVHAVRAQILASSGADDRAAAELRTCEELFQRLPASVVEETRSVAGWAEGRLRYTEAWVHAHAGDRDRLDAAVFRTQEVSPSDERPFLVQLDLLRAAGHVRSGDATEGVRHAHAVYEAQPHERRTVMVTSLARQVADAVPAARRADPLVTGYQELLASGSGRGVTT